MSSIQRDKRYRQHLQIAGRTGALAAHFCTYDTTFADIYFPNEASYAQAHTLLPLHTCTGLRGGGSILALPLCRRRKPPRLCKLIRFFRSEILIIL